MHKYIASPAFAALSRQTLIMFSLADLGRSLPSVMPYTLSLQALMIRSPVQELILFSRADLERSIPSMVDGFKPGQRKIMFACFKRNLKKDIKVRTCMQANTSLPFLSLKYSSGLQIRPAVLGLGVCSKFCESTKSDLDGLG